MYLEREKEVDCDILFQEKKKNRMWWIEKPNHTLSMECGKDQLTSKELGKKEPEHKQGIMETNQIN